MHQYPLVWLLTLCVNCGCYVKVSVILARPPMEGLALQKPPPRRVPEATDFSIN